MGRLTGAAACALAVLVAGCGASQPPGVPASVSGEPMPAGVSVLRSARLPPGAAPAWFDTHATVRRLDDGGNYNAAVQLAIGSGRPAPAPCSGAWNRT